jgi:hypothetical protein
VTVLLPGLGRKAKKEEKVRFFGLFCNGETEEKFEAIILTRRVKCVRHQRNNKEWKVRSISK